jgi:hypothetical protein
LELPALQAPQELPGLQEILALQARKARKVILAQLDRKVFKVFKERKVILDQQAQLALLARVCLTLTADTQTACTAALTQ